LQPDSDQHESTNTTTTPTSAGANNSNQKGNSNADQQQQHTGIAAAQQHTNKPVIVPSLKFPLAMNDFDITEEDGHFVLSTDLPGVKPADMKVSFQDGALIIEAERTPKNGSTTTAAQQTFLRKLAVDEDALDVASFSATLEDGVLTLKAPKKTAQGGDSSSSDADGSNEACKIAVKSQDAPEEATEMELELDLPGVKADNVEIKLDKKDGMLGVSAERMKSNKRTKVAEAYYMLNTRKVDTSKLEAYLVDGVLTIRAPAKPRVSKLIPMNGKLPATEKAEEKQQQQQTLNTKEDEKKNE
jgi:HSP20 family molecular chaperone IbpA